MSTKSAKYEINEKDIDTILNILKRDDPEHATPERAIAILEYWQTKIHELSHTDPEKLIELYNKLKKGKGMKN